MLPCLSSDYTECPLKGAPAALPELMRNPGYDEQLVSTREICGLRFSGENPFCIFCQFLIEPIACPAKCLELAGF